MGRNDPRPTQRKAAPDGAAAQARWVIIFLLEAELSKHPGHASARR
jgi:hypothetical protein